ncbi:MAG: hypothetical protein B7Z80_26130 [Rhodospirillales bacterium 20-64-7]|nr:MAG: hypothetical protein B7Z80_26130 [Rhodospirillales bacterium 20-64-7]
MNILLAVINFVFRVLQTLGLFRADLSSRVTDRMPLDSDVKEGELVIVENNGLQKWACLKCPGGCGLKIALSLNFERRPRWRVCRDWIGRPSIEPSIHQKNACQCHFWIRRGQIQWCPDGHRRLHRPAMPTTGPIPR